MLKSQEESRSKSPKAYNAFGLLFGAVSLTVVFLTKPDAGRASPTRAADPQPTVGWDFAHSRPLPSRPHAAYVVP
jgi:hypothetical protein